MTHQPPPPTTASVIDAYIATRQARNCSPSYIAFLRYALRHLARDHEFLPTTPEPIEATLATLTQADSTRLSIWKAIRRLYAWTNKRHGHPNAASHIEKPIVTPKLIRALSQLQIDRLLWANQTHRRDNALLLLLLDTGARIGEAINVTAADITPTAVSFRIPKRGTRARQVPISDETAAALRLITHLEPLWQGERGALTLHGLKKVVHHALARASIDGGPHLLRHTFATRFLQNGGDLIHLSRIGGWTNADTVTRYVANDLGDITAAHARCSPIANHTPAARQLTLLPAYDEQIEATP